MTDRRRRLSALALLTGAALLVSACAGGGFGRGVSADERRQYDAAIAQLPDDPAAAEAALRQFLADYPQSRLADDAGEELARVSLLQGRRDEAFEWLHWVVKNHPEGDRVDSVRVRLARWEFERGDEEQSRQLLDLVRESRLDAADRRALYRLRANMAVDPVERVDHLSRLRELLDQQWQEQVDREGDSAVSDKMLANLVAVDAEIDGILLEMSDMDLVRTGRNLRSRVPAGRVRLLLARRALDAGNFEGAQHFLDEAGRYRLTAADEERVASLELRLGLRDDVEGGVYLPTFREAASRPWPSLDEVRGTLGVALPLSGRYASFGQEALRGIMLAARIFERVPVMVEGDAGRRGSGASAARELSADPGAPSEVPGVRLVVRDTAGSPERAAAVVRELAGDPEVVAIIGPIFSAECEAAAREAGAVGVPLLTLSNRSEIASENDYVFRLRTTPEDEVGFLVDHAVEELGAEHFAVLYPASRYGRGMRTRYWEAVLARGGTLVAAAGYEPDATDMSEAIRALIGYELLTPREIRALREREQALRRGRRLEPKDAALLRRVLYDMLGPEAEPLPPIVDFDALFIPDGYEKVRLIAPQLALHEVDGVRLLGSSEWYVPDLEKVDERHMRGAVIATSFHLESKHAIVRDFVAAYEETFAARPGLFSSNAYDAANIALVQLAGGSTERKQLRDGILRVHGYPGVSGVTSIMPDGNARKRPFLLTISRAGIVGID